MRGVTLRNLLIRTGIALFILAWFPVWVQRGYPDSYWVGPLWWYLAKGPVTSDEPPSR